MKEPQLKRQPRAKVMLPAIRELITRRALENQEKKRNLLADELIEEIKAKFPYEIPPVEDTVIRRISEARNHDPDIFDEPWHLGTLEKHPIPSEVVPLILKIQNLAPNFKVSIRQAKWINKLHHVVTDIKWLSNISWNYTFHEKISIISHSEPFDTSEYDRFLVNPKQQKELINLFRSKQKDVDWSLRKKVHEQMTGIPLGEELFGYEFKGDEVFALSTQGNSYNIGTRDYFIKKHLFATGISEPSKLPEGDYILKPKIRTFIAPEVE